MVARKLTTQEFISKAKKVHGAKYRYDATDYSGAKTKVKIWCKRHKEYFNQVAFWHTQGHGCPKCGREAAGAKQRGLKRPGQGGGSAKLTLNQFLVRCQNVHGNLYDYSSTKYKGMHATIVAICKKHGKFRVGASMHVHQGIGCQKCGKERVQKAIDRRKITSQEYIQRCKKKHGLKFNYSKIKPGLVTLNKDILQIKCPDHGWMEILAVTHLSRTPCRLCKVGCSNYSVSAIAWLEYESRKRRLKIQHAQNGKEFCIPGTKFKADGYNPRTKTIFEFYGDVYHGNLTKFKPNSRPHPFSNRTAKYLHQRTLKREKILRSLGYKVVSIWESQWREFLLGNRKRL